MKNNQYIPTLLGLLFIVVLVGCQDEEDVSIKAKTYSKNELFLKIFLDHQKDQSLHLGISFKKVHATSEYRQKKFLDDVGRSNQLLIPSSPFEF